MPTKSALAVLKAKLKLFLLRLFFWGIPRRIPFLGDQQIGLNLIGFYRGDLGLGDALRYIAKAIERAQIPFLVREFQTPLLSSQHNNTLNSFVSTYSKYPVNCIAVNPDVIYHLPMWVSFSEWAYRYNIGYWFWELENFPHDWRYAIPLIDEIWVNTEFVASAMRQAHSRVIKIPFAVEFEIPNTKFTRKYFDLPEKSLLFLCTFDFQSSVVRKNPKATIDAFLTAFHDQPSDVYLVVKSVNGDLHPQIFAELKLRASHDPRILFMNQQLSTEEMRGLLLCADCYVSLHRSEGVGLGMAESMYLGKPVIATAYSGNMEFMTNETAYLIPYKQITVSDGEYLDTKKQVWADANITEAAMAMQNIFNNAELRAKLGSRARAYMLEHHSFATMGAAITKRLEQIKNNTSL